IGHLIIGNLYDPSISIKLKFINSQNLTNRKAVILDSVKQIIEHSTLIHPPVILPWIIMKAQASLPRFGLFEFELYVIQQGGHLFRFVVIIKPAVLIYVPVAGATNFSEILAPQIVVLRARQYLMHVRKELYEGLE